METHGRAPGFFLLQLNNKEQAQTTILLSPILYFNFKQKLPALTMIPSPAVCTLHGVTYGVRHRF
jgi:hypothetical protein